MCRFLYCMCSIQESCGTQCFLKLKRVLGSLSAVIVYYKSSFCISACLSGRSVNSSFYSFYWHSDGFPNILWIYLPSPILYFYSIYVCVRAHMCVHTCAHAHMHTSAALMWRSERNHVAPGYGAQVVSKRRDEKQLWGR